LAKSLLVAESMMKTGELAKGVDARYAAWGQDLGQKILSADHTLESLSDWALESNINPKPVSGQQELLENVYNRYVFSKSAKFQDIQSAYNVPRFARHVKAWQCAFLLPSRNIRGPGASYASINLDPLAAIAYQAFS
jgi:hypothetical protein